MPNIVKFFEQGEAVKSYEFPLQFSEQPYEEREKLSFKKGDEFVFDEFEEDKLTSIEEDEQAEQEQENDIQEEVIEPSPEELLQNKVSEIENEARLKAEEIIQSAKEEAERLKSQALEEGKKEGYKLGYEQGYQAGEEESRRVLDEKTNEFMRKLETVIHSVEQKKMEILQKYRNDLKDIAIAVGEKVIQISLKSSGEVIERMIISATEKLKTKEWAKIYIAQCDAELMVEGDIDILTAITHLSKHLKVITMENESPGTCIVELPDEIIDASANTQVENIKGILNSAGL